MKPLDFVIRLPLNLAFMPLLFLACALQAEERTHGFHPAFYAFENGVSFGDLKQEAETLKSIGFSGISQVKHGGDQLTQQIEVYEAAGLKVLSIYLDVHDQPIQAAVVKPFANRGALIELTVRKMHSDPKVTMEAIRQTADMAEKLKIKVALYPHYKFGIATFAEAIDMAEQIKHPNLGVVFNVCHFLRGEDLSDMEPLLVRAGEKLFAVTTNGAAVQGKNWKALIQPLDLGDFPQDKLFGILKKMHFTGPVGLQCYGIKGDKRANLERSMKAWRSLLQTLRQS